MLSRVDFSCHIGTKTIDFRLRHLKIRNHRPIRQRRESAAKGDVKPRRNHPLRWIIRPLAVAKLDPQQINICEAGKRQLTICLFGKRSNLTSMLVHREKKAAGPPAQGAASRGLGVIAWQPIYFHLLQVTGRWLQMPGKIFSSTKAAG